MNKPGKKNLLARARHGDHAALGELISQHQQLLERMAQNEVAGRLQARLSATDVVQQTCLSAIRNFSDFRGEDEGQFAAWLRGVHERNVTDMIRRHVYTEKRAIGLQESLSEASPPHADAPTASRRAIQNESATRLNEALNNLPPAQAQAVRLRHIDQLSLREIAEKTGATEVAVASLIKRGLAGLRNQMPTDFG